MVGGALYTKKAAFYAQKKDAGNGDGGEHEKQEWPKAKEKRSWKQKRRRILCPLSFSSKGTPLSIWTEFQGFFSRWATLVELYFPTELAIYIYIRLVSNFLISYYLRESALLLVSFL